jgi:hypothetical protein
MPQGLHEPGAACLCARLLELEWLVADIRSMAAAPSGGVTTPARLDIVSPELVLVDPLLGAHARAFLSDSADTLSRIAQSPPDGGEPLPASIRDGGAWPHADDASADARERLMDGALDSEVLGSIVPYGRQFRRRATLIPATSAATSVALFVVQVYLSQGRLM